MEALRLEIVTPDKVVLEADVDYVGAPGVDGEFGVLPGHIPLLAALSIGELYYRQGAETRWAFVAGGFAEVSGNRVSILAEAAELSSDIDVGRAKQARERAQGRLQAGPGKADVDLARASAALKRAVARIHVASR
ncbi:MAG: F0F1 ATP synthase subunit epsilon [Desulfovibrionaceae bacterium]|nr:F0F1 ATP synthase subunit epsilon [Desulfovibrionaceae bacterium]